MKLRSVQLEFRIILTVIGKTPVVKKKLAESRPLDPFQELLRDYLVRIDIGTIERSHKATMFSKWLHGRFQFMAGSYWLMPNEPLRGLTSCISNGSSVWRQIELIHRSLEPHPLHLTPNYSRAIYCGAVSRSPASSKNAMSLLTY